MPLFDDVRAEIADAKKLRIPGWAIPCLIATSYLCGTLFDNFGQLDLVMPVFNTAMVLTALCVLKRKLWRRVWFWFAMLVIAIVHGLLIVRIPWGSRWIPASVVAAVDSVDLCFLILIITFFSKLIVSGNQSGHKEI